MLNLHEGDRVRIYGAKTWANGTIEDIRPIAELPQIPGAPDPAQVAEILAEGNCTTVALMSFEDGRITKVFAAFLVDGIWRDRKGQPLTIAKRNQTA